MPAAENPADLGTQAIVPFKQGDLWTKGPTWLNNPEAQPKQPEILETEHTKSELAGKKIKTLMAATTEQTTEINNFIEPMYKQHNYWKLTEE